ncbi:hypothetical protein J3R30DRAFT_3242416, partial [Lentinula aciculospora]
SKTQKARISELQAEVDRLQEELGQDKDAEKIVNKHIKLLHRYNEAKDAAQVREFQLANLKETTVRQIHKNLEL